MLLIPIQVCCNDPRNGMPSGKVIEIHAEGCEFESRFIDEDEDGDLVPDRPEFREVEGAIYVGHIRLKVFQSRDWYGNWCWNQYQVPWRHWERLKRSGLFRHWFTLDAYTADTRAELDRIFDDWEYLNVQSRILKA